MRKLLIRGGRLVDPATRTDEYVDLLIVDGVVADRASNPRPDEETRVIEAAGAIVAPGLVDMHVHLREPGREDEETIESGSRAAAHGGITAVAAMPNTEPAIDTASWVAFVRNHASPIEVYPIAAITRGRAGETLTEMAELAAAGAVAFSDDGSPVASPSIMRRALEYSTMVGLPVISHCEELELVGAGVMHEGLASTMAGLRPIPAAAEEIAVARDIILAKMTGASLHIAHVSTKGAVELVRRAKDDGVAVTCETCPHYFTLTDNDVRSYDTNLRVNPPLRTASDIAAIKAGLADGTIDAIASDHAPHSLEEKQVEFDAAPPGMIGLETLLPLTLTELVQPGTITLERAIELMSTDPASILGIPHGSLAVGAPADVTVFDPDWAWKITGDWFVSKSKNSPFTGRVVRGRVTHTVSRGEVVFEESAFDEGDARAQGRREPDELPVHV
ncbi:MAG: dihydroorotase [Candidatus Eisenbacteria bacterium]